jgi:enterochelin esterase-like enzyme
MPNVWSKSDFDLGECRGGTHGKSHSGHRRGGPCRRGRAHGHRTAVEAIIASHKLPLAFYLDAGSEEIDFSGYGNSVLLTTRNLRDVLLAKGYDVHFQEFAGGHDYLGWRGTLADGLIVLMAPMKPIQESAAKPNGKM